MSATAEPMRIAREVAVGASHATDPFRCPTCGGGNVLIEGSYRRNYIEEFQNGESVGKQLEESIEQNVLAINCGDCAIRHILEPDAMFAMREANLQLTMEVAKLKGLNIVDMKNAKVN